MDSPHPNAAYRLLPDSTTLAEHLASPGADQVVLIGRVLIGIIFVLSGWGKITALTGFAAVLESRGVPAAYGIADGLAVIGAAVEFFGGLALVFGVATRAVALLMFVFVLVATGLSHRFWEFEGAARRAQEINFEKNIAILGSFLLLAVLGAGRFGLDHVWHRRKP